jgi:hypothetical protein
MKTFRPYAVLGALALLSALPVVAQDAGELKFDEDSFEVLEGAGMAIVTVERSRGEDGAVTVDYATSDGTATDGSDYTGVSGTLSWGAGDGTDRTFQIPILDDADAEGAETIQLTLSNPTGGAILSPGRDTSVVVILANDGGAGGGGDDNGGDDNGGGDNGGDDNGGDDNGGDDNGGDDNGGGAGSFKLDQRNFLALETSGMAVISVERSHGETGAVTVDYSTADGSATGGSDYTPVSGTLSWADGDESRKTFQVPILADGEQESAESLDLILSNPTGGAVLDDERATAILTILDSGDQAPPGDDNSRPGVLKFDERGFQVIEDQAMAVIRVERSRGSRGAVSVEYSTSDGSAADGSDYTGVSGVLSWANGDETAKTFEVPILEDDATEGNETVNLTLSNPVGGATLDPERGVSVLNILDNDGSTAACISDSTTMCLAGGRFRVNTVWRTGNGNTGVGRVIPSTDNSGLVWFFGPNNVEMLVKVLDACNLQGFQSYWVFFAATTNVDFTVTVTDTATGVTKEYMNPSGQAASPVQDTLSFKTCP